MSDKVIYTGESVILSADEIHAVFKGYLSSEQYEKISTYEEYYEGENCEILKRFRDRKERNKTPNNLIPTAYYRSVIDAMAGYMFSDVQYQGREESDAAYVEALQTILDDNAISIKDMAAGVRSLAFNKAYELVYTVGDGNTTQIKVATLNPKNTFCIYNNDIEPAMICGVRFVKGEGKEERYKLDVIYATVWQRYSVTTGTKGDEIKLIDERPLFFPACPVVEYNSEVITDDAPFAIILPYIDALDLILSGNSNEIERLTDALLVIGKLLKDKDLKHMDEIKALMGFKQEDRAEFITKNNDPAFREYVSRLLIQEIHKHSHVIDWYGGDATTGTISAKAYRTRLHDMSVFSNRIEQVHREGAEKRLVLLSLIYISEPTRSQSISLDDLY